MLTPVRTLDDEAIGIDVGVGTCVSKYGGFSGQRSDESLIKFASHYDVRTVRFTGRTPSGSITPDSRLKVTARISFPTSINLSR